MYPYQRAEQMLKNIKRLGTSKNGTNYIDKFRQLITQIGNALGYVRIIRTASLKDNANLVKYIPEFVEKIKFEQVAEELGIRGETMEAIKIFDLCIKNLFKQSDDAGDYLRMIVNNFEGITEQENTKHLKLFYLIIPPLTISFIEHIQKGKEKL
jgi:WASH complex subunit 7